MLLVAAVVLPDRALQVTVPGITIDWIITPSLSPLFKVANCLDHLSLVSGAQIVVKG